MEFEKRGQFFKVDDGQGIAYGWAIVCSEHGKDYVDLQGDHIPESAMLAAAEDFANNSRVAKDMHEGAPVGEFPFLYPVTKSSKDLGIDSDRTGLLVGFKPSDPELLKLIASGERTGFSIGGVLEESTDEPIGKSFAKAAGATATKARVFRTFKINEISLVDAPAQEGATVGYVKRALLVRKGMWTTATVDDFPDSSFLYVEPGGKKDAGDKTTPRSLRHFPYRDENGKIDIDHLRDAIGRIPQSSLPATLRNKLQVKAEKLLAAQHNKKRSPHAKALVTGKCTAGHDMPIDKAACPDCGADMAYKRLAKFTGGAIRVLKDAALTSEEDGHVHAIDLDDPATAWMDMYSTSWQTSEGADNGHSHSWTFDETSGAITIGADSGHEHTLDAVVPPDALAAYAALDAAKDRDNAAVAAEITDTPSDGIPGLLTDEESSGKTAIVIVQSRAPHRKSTPSQAVKHAANTTRETQMPTEQTKIVILTEAQHAHFGKLSGADADAFVAKSAAERDAIVKAAHDADPVVFKGDVTGIEVRKSQGDFALRLATQNEANAATIAKQVTELAKANELQKTAIYKARAQSEIGHLAGSEDAKVALLKAIDGIADEKIRGEVVTMQKSVDAFAKEAGAPKGADPGEDAGEGSGGDVALVAAVTKYQADHKLPSYEIALAKATVDDPAIRKLWDAAVG